jgi:hypothetical protein
MTTEELATVGVPPSEDNASASTSNLAAEVVRESASR